ncbi:coatomer subunit epsilon [Sitodiplosis mosellana]|uniref:coatomer subunit epsilon n=1 Tax=Sitodiplosis mosellana TaxID=263140 RepID=UPI00244388DB|nr:coatomer subunit epsilon [Sitodiplosis mosellana]
MSRQNNSNGGQNNNEVDELFEVKTYFYIGAYQQCLNEINKLRGGSSLKKDCFMYRAYIAQHKYRVVLDGISEAPSTPAGLKAIRKVAEYFNSIDSADKRGAIVKYFDENRSSVVVEDENADEDTVYSSIVWALSAASVYYNEQLYENALSLVHTAIKISPDLECLATQLQCHLKINRLDLAKGTLSKMQEKDDDATLTQLATAWIHIEQGGEKLQDAYYIFQDFCDKFVPTSLLLNGQAVCFIAQEKYEEADAALRNSLDKDPNDLDTFINLIALAQHYNVSGKPQEDVINRYLSQIKDLHPHCQLVVDLDRKEQEFQRLCARYAPTNQA